MKRYLCIGGYVFSPHDGDRHWVSADRLPALYGVDPRDCVLMRDDAALERSGMRDRHGLTVLRPSSRGDYSLP